MQSSERRYFQTNNWEGEFTGN